ncbi:LytR C-terminal domain-containing protein [Candidatus Berkelbacteria bacterium]|nr:LytR C-terminal domain-containing protein [Candidatus Berkelbacteria bacterium]
MLGFLLLLFLIKPSGQVSEADQSDRTASVPSLIDTAERTSGLGPASVPQGSGPDSVRDELVILDAPLEESAPQDPGLESTARPAETIPPESQVDRASLTVRVLNGGGPAGAAAALRDRLEAGGYRVLSVGNAINPHARTTVYYATGFEEQAQTLANDLSESTPILIQSSIASPADVLVVIGSDR